MPNEVVPMKGENDAKIDEDLFTQDANAAIYDLGGHVKIDFHEVFSAPDAYEDNVLGKTIGDKVIDIGYYNLFTYVQAGVYYILSVIVGFAASLAWGIVFGANTIMMTWLLQPIIKLIFTWIRLLGIFLRAVLRSFMDPCFQSLGLSLSSIRGKFTFGPESGENLTKALQKV